MAATHGRRTKGVSRAKSMSYVLRNISEPIVTPESVLATFDAQNKTIRQIVYDILSSRGPYTSYELVEECAKLGRHTTIGTIRAIINELRKLNLVVKANGGYAIHNWMEIGA